MKSVDSFEIIGNLIYNYGDRMRKLILQVQISVDGFIAGPNGEMDWMVWNWDDKLNQYVKELTGSIDCILLGRKLAEGFIPHWAAVASDRDNPEYAAGRMFMDTNKVVFSRTRDKSEWENTVLAKGDLPDEVTKLKAQEGKAIIAYGGATFVSALNKNRLIDEFHFFINPTAIGAGMKIFSEPGSKQKLSLVKSTSFECGIVVLHYEKSDA
jgi:dihydrofolate reductase